MDGCVKDLGDPSRHTLTLYNLSMLIELGDTRAAPAEPPPRPWPRRMVLRAVLVSLTMLMVLSLGASAYPPRALIVLSDFAVAAGQPVSGFTGDTLVMQSVRTTDVRDLDGRLRWSVEAWRFGTSWPRAEQGLLIFQSLMRTPPRSVALGLADGREAWSFDGEVVLRHNVIAVDPGGAGSFAVYDPVTLNPVWRADGLAFAIGEPEPVALILGRDGTLTERDLRTGAILRSAAAQLSGPGPYRIAYYRSQDFAAVSGDKPAFVRLGAADSRTFVAVRPGSLPAAAPKPDCGPVTCEADGQTSTTLVSEPATGIALWRGPPGTSLYFTPSGLVSYGRDRGEAAYTLRLHDTNTGRVLRTLTGWQVIPLTPGRAGVAPVVLRKISGSPVRTQIAGFTPGGFRVFGSVPRDLTECRFEAWRLACTAGRGRLMVIEIRSGVGGVHRPAQHILRR